MPSCILRLALPSPLRRLFDYLPPRRNCRSLQPGMRSRVPFGRRGVIGVLVELSDQSEVPLEKLRPAIEAAGQHAAAAALPVQALSVDRPVLPAQPGRHPELGTAGPAARGEPAEARLERYWRLADGANPGRSPTGARSASA